MEVYKLKLKKERILKIIVLVVVIGLYFLIPAVKINVNQAIFILKNVDVDLAITKIVNDNTPDEGDSVTYTITVENNGPAAATNIVLTDPIPTGTTLQSLGTPTAGAIVP